MKWLFFTTWLIGTFMTFKGFASEYHYDNYSLDSDRSRLPNSFYFNLKDSYMLDPTNEYVVFTLCKSDSKYFCLNAGHFYFAVPTSGLKKGDSWELDSRKFMVKDEIALKVFGISEQAYLVEMIVEEKLKYQFYYSIGKGLLAFSTTSLDDGRTTMYWLREKEGLGATSE